MGALQFGHDVFGDGSNDRVVTSVDDQDGASAPSMPQFCGQRNLTVAGDLRSYSRHGVIIRRGRFIVYEVVSYDFGRQSSSVDTYRSLGIDYRLLSQSS